MSLIIAHTFQTALARLPEAAQRAVKQTAFDMQLDPEGENLIYEPLADTGDPRFCALRAAEDLRLIIHRLPGQSLLAYAGQRDAAARWAQTHKIEVHPKTGAAQIVALTPSQAAPSQATPSPAPSKPTSKPALAALSDAELLSAGVPADNLSQVRAAGEETLLSLLETLPGEAGERLLALKDGLWSPEPEPEEEDATPHDAFTHRDAQRRFRLLSNRAELQQALDFPWDQWTVFLHPAQRALVQRAYRGPARVTGSAGTGKTIVALHRAVWLARQRPAARILLTTYSKTLARSLGEKLARLLPPDGAARGGLTVLSIEEVMLQAGREVLPSPQFATAAVIAGHVRSAMAAHGYDRHRAGFVIGEFLDVVDAWQIRTLKDYLAVTRLGRRTPLNAEHRKALWPLYVHVRHQLAKARLITRADAYGLVATQRLAAYDHIIVDEAQDLSVPQLRFLASANGSDQPDALFFAGDLGQRIFQVPFSWTSLGIEIRGRASRLKVNYRTSHQIRRQADRLLPDEIEDGDGNRELRAGTVSVFNGPAPDIQLFGAPEAEAAKVGDWIQQRLKEGTRPEEIGIFVRSEAQMARAQQALSLAGVSFGLLSETEAKAPNGVSLGTMHLAKGLEFRAVAVMACDDEVIPLQSRLEDLGDQGDLDEVYASERQLLYVACTRARERLWVSGVAPESEFLADLR